MPPTTDELDARVTCLENQVQDLKERDDVLNDRLKAVEDQIQMNVWSPGSFGYGADMGTNNANQTDAANLFLSWRNADPCECLLTGLLAGGGTNYPSGDAATIEANWAAFSAFVDAGQAFPAMGVQDLATLNGQALMDKFPGLFTDGATPTASQRRYYHQHFVNGDLDLFVLNSDDTEPDGNTVGSTQYNWFVQALAASKGRWKVVMFHHPIVTTVSTGGPFFNANMDWGFEALGVHLGLVGNTYSNSHIRKNGLDWVDASMTSQLSRAHGSLVGQTTGAAVVWQDEDQGAGFSDYKVVRITPTPTQLKVEWFKTTDGTASHSFTV